MYKIFVVTEKDGQIVMPKKDLEDIIQEAYNAGVSDGKSTIIAPSSPLWWKPGEKTIDITCDSTASNPNPFPTYVK